MQQAVLKADSMSCGHCTMTVEGAAGALEGVDSVSANLETKEVEVSYDPDVVSLDEIKKAIEEAGYPVE